MKLLAVSILLSFLLFSCSKKGENLSQDELEVISIDLSKAYDGKLSEFFEPEVDYIWLKDDSEEAQLSAGLNKILFYKDKIMTMDIFGCKCIKIFDKKGNYLSQIGAFGDGPEKYLDLDNFMVHDNEVLLLGVFPPKLMWFDLEGDFLREMKVEMGINAGVYLKSNNRYHFSMSPYRTEEYLVISVNADFKDSTGYFPTVEGGFYGNFSGRNNFILSGDETYFTYPFQDTIFQLSEENYIPKLVFDYRGYGQDIEEYKMKMENLDPMERMDFLNKKSKLYFVPRATLLSDNYFSNSFRSEETSYSVFYDRENRKTFVLNWGIENDLDEGYNPYSLQYVFDNGKHAGLKIAGIDLYEILQNKKEKLGQEAFESYINGKGKKFAEVATAAKDSENPVLIIYTLKK
jgi:predicted heme/steroid binding protein